MAHLLGILGVYFYKPQFCPQINPHLVLCRHAFGVNACLLSAAVILVCA
jgi:hypothetical protein